MRLWRTICGTCTISSSTENSTRCVCTVNHGEGGRLGPASATFLVYLEKIKTKRVYLHDTTVVTPYTLMLFCGGEFSIVYERGLVEIDGWIRLRVPAQTAVLFKKMRQIINGHLISKLHTSSGVSDYSDKLMDSLSRIV